MSITIELTPEEETLLRDAAEKRGEDTKAFAKEAFLYAARQAVQDEKTRQNRELWEKWDAAGERATKAAWADLHAAGLGVVYARPDGVVVEELPDGTIRPLTEEMK